MAPGIAEKKNNSLPLWGNEKTMNLNNLILTNILSSHYFKVNLYQLKTYHEVIDEIYYKVNHLEPWEKGSRKTAGQTGMCGGVRGVGAGGIVSTAFCILYKLFTLKLTRKQVVGLINHSDSPYIRALGFMYIRYTQPPVDLWDWYESYLTDPEEIDVKAGGGQAMTIGEMLRHFLSKLEWFSTLFPRIPVPIQKDLEGKLFEWRSRPENKAFVEADNSNSLHQSGTDDWASEHSVSNDPDYANASHSQSRSSTWRNSSSRHHSSDRRSHKNRSRSPLRSSRRVRVGSHHSRERHRNRDHDSRRSNSRDRGSSRYFDKSYSKDRFHDDRRREREVRKPEHDDDSRHHSKHSHSRDH